MINGGPNEMETGMDNEIEQPPNPQEKVQVILNAKPKTSCTLDQKP